MDVEAIAAALDSLISSCTTHEIAVLRRWTEDVRRNPSDHDMQEYAVRVMDAMRNAKRHMIAAYQLALEIALSEEEMHPETWLVVPDDHAMQIRLKLQMREQS